MISGRWFGLVGGLVNLLPQGMAVGWVEQSPGLLFFILLSLIIQSLCRFIQNISTIFMSLYMSLESTAVSKSALSLTDDELAHHITDAHPRTIKNVRCK